MSTRPQRPLAGLSSFQGQFLGVENVARILGVSADTVRRWTQNENPADRLAHVRIGTLVRVDRNDLIDFLNRNSTGIEYVDPHYQPEEEGSDSEGPYYYETD